MPGFAEFIWTVLPAYQENCGGTTNDAPKSPNQMSGFISKVSLRYNVADCQIETLLGKIKCELITYAALLVAGVVSRRSPAVPPVVAALAAFKIVGAQSNFITALLTVCKALSANVSVVVPPPDKIVVDR